METGPLTRFDLLHMQRLPLVPISVPPPGPAHGVAKRLRSGFPFRDAEVRIPPPQPASPVARYHVNVFPTHSVSDSKYSRQGGSFRADPDHRESVSRKLSKWSPLALSDRPRLVS
jgi:hypothetical protein